MTEKLAEKMLHKLNYSFNLIRRERHNPENRGGGVRRGQGRLMGILLQKGVTTQTELAELLQIRAASLGELVYKLECKGFVERRPNEDDKRRIDVSLTPEGRDKALEIAESRQSLAEDLFSGLSLEEQRQFAALLDKFVATLESRQTEQDGSDEEETCHKRHCCKHHYADFGDTGPRCKDAYEHGGDMGFDRQTPRDKNDK